ncbi:uncharacterized protein LOC8031232 [Ixodes scapularis]|uniref:uncharacterized protein LOC8031232 n=1 Tax=Ixodes scapularis TaxID=6945 RepID=UPI001C38FB42|nr:uncharacterized protein LOC8031232 [Ixodes scapularis]
MRIIGVVVVPALAAVFLWQRASASDGGSSGRSSSDGDIIATHTITHSQPEEVSRGTLASLIHSSQEYITRPSTFIPSYQITTNTSVIEKDPGEILSSSHSTPVSLFETLSTSLPIRTEKHKQQDRVNSSSLLEEYTRTEKAPVRPNSSSVFVFSTVSRSVLPVLQENLNNEDVVNSTVSSQLRIVELALEGGSSSSSSYAIAHQKTGTRASGGAVIEPPTGSTEASFIPGPEAIDVASPSSASEISDEDPEELLDPSLRVLRSIHPSTASASVHFPHHSHGREATPIMPSPVSASERTRGGGGKPSIDNILSGIIQLLGGDANQPRPPSMRFPPPPLLPPPQPHKLPSRINNRGPPNFNFPPPPPRPPQFPHHLPHPPHPPHHQHSRPNLPHLAPPQPGHFDTIPRPPPPNLHFPPVNHPNHPHHPQQHIHIVPLPHPPTVYPTPSEVSHLLGLNEQDRQPEMPPMENDRHSATPALSQVDLHNGHVDDVTMHRETVLDSVPESTTEQLPSSKSTIVLIHEGPVTSTSASIDPTRSVGTASEERPPDVSESTSQDTHSTDTSDTFDRPSDVPSGPVSGWLPVFLDSSNRHNSTRVTVNTAEEPEIITEPTEPSVFDITVVHSIGTINHNVTPSKTKQPTFETIPPTRSEVGGSDESIDTFQIEEAKTTVTQTAPTEAYPSRVDERDREPEVIYGTPTIDKIVPSKTPLVSLSPTSTQPNTKDSDAVMTLSGKGTLTPEMTHTRAPVRHQQHQSPTGRPIVIPVEIEDVRPVIGFPPELSHGFPRPPGSPPLGSTPRPKTQTTSGQKQTSKGPPRRRPPYRAKHNTTLVRIDTCIVGDDSTCDSQLNEWCKAELGVSSCHCRPGFTRTVPRGPCTPIVTVGLTLKLDRLGEQKLVFNRNYRNPESEDYQLLEYEAKQALHSLFTKSSFSRVFMDVTVNKFQSAGSKVMVNATVQLEENDITRVPSVKRVLQHEVVNMINRRNSNVGESRLFVDGMLNSGLAVDDVNECNDMNLNDCSANGVCENVFGTFRCACKAGYTDKYPDTKWKSGRTCSACAPDYCNLRGECRISNGHRECSCRGKYIGARCDIDGEVLAVALGASITAVIIIVLTLVCLCLWNRRWKREQHKAEVMSAHSAGSLGYLSKVSTLGPAYRVSVEDRMRWQHIADAMGNIYVQPEATAPPKTPPVFASPPRVRSPSPPEESHYSHIQRPRSRGAMYGPPPNHASYEYEPPKRDAYTPVMPYYKTATLRTMYS